MEKFIIRTKLVCSSSETCSDSSGDSSVPSAKRSCNDCVAGSSSDASSRMKSYKSKLRYNPEWRLKWTWMEYDDAGEGMLRSLVRSLEGHPPKLMVHGLLGLSTIG